MYCGPYCRKEVDTIVWLNSTDSMWEEMDSDVCVCVCVREREREREIKVIFFPEWTFEDFAKEPWMAERKYSILTIKVANLKNAGV